MKTKFDAKVLQNENICVYLYSNFGKANIDNDKQTVD